MIMIEFYHPDRFYGTLKYKKPMNVYHENDQGELSFSQGILGIE